MQDHQINEQSFPSRDMIYKFDPGGYFTFVNPALADFFDMRPERLIGVHFTEVIAKSHRESVSEFYQDQFNRRLPSTYLEFPVKLDHSKVRWIGQTVEAIVEDDRVVEFLAVSSDITDRVLATKSLKYTEERYRQVIDNINLGTLEVDMDDVIINANNTFCELVGYDVDELIGKRAKSLISGETVYGFDDIKTIGQVALDSPAKELMLITSNYRLVWVMVSGVPIRNKYEEEVGYLCVFYDSTERKEEELIRQRAELALKESESRMRAILDSSLDGMITIDEQGLVTEWNPRAEEIFGYKGSETIGKSLNDLIIPEKYREAHQHGMQRFLTSGEGPVLNRRIEIHAEHKDGSYFPVELSIVSIKLNNHYIFSAFIRDITLRKKAEDDMATALQRQKELADLKSRLISMTSHEYRTPLTTIKSSLDLLTFILENQELKNGDKVEKNINRINHEIKRLDSLVNDILLVGKLETGNLPYNLTEVDIVELIEGVIEADYSNEKDGRHVKLEVKGKPKKLLIDENLYSHILSNLISNAFKYSPGSGNPCVCLNFKDDYLEISVKDKGIGIPDSDINLLFDSFYRAGNVKNIQGHGMGLAIVKQFLELHGGTVEVQSELDRGTEFIIHQPYSESK